MDRVSNSIHMATEADEASCKSAEQRFGFRLALTSMMQNHVVAGLHGAIRRPIEARLSTLGTKGKILEAAVEVEAAEEHRKPTARVAAVDADAAAQEGQDEEVAAVSNNFRTRGGRGGGRGKRGGGGGRGGASAGNKLSKKERFDKTRQQCEGRIKWINCHKCKQWGTHYLSLIHI